MKRALAFLAAVLLFAAAGYAMHALALPDPPMPLAIDDPQSGDVVLWPGSSAPAPEDPPAPAMRVVPCELGPSTLPILPERTV